MIPISPKAKFSFDNEISLEEVNVFIDEYVTHLIYEYTNDVHGFHNYPINPDNEGYNEQDLHFIGELTMDIWTYGHETKHFLNIPATFNRIPNKWKD